jgi:cytochrome c556
MMRHAMAGVGMLLMALAGTSAVAHDEKDPRHQAMEALGKSMKAISQTVKSGAAIDADTMAHARRIAETGDRVLDLFPEGPIGHGSRAKPEIWSDWSGFSAKAEAFGRAADGLLVAVQDGEPSRVEAALKQVGATCGGCHKPYRKPKK